MKRHKVTNKSNLTAKQTELLGKLETMPESEIDYSDISESTNWSDAISSLIVSANNNSQSHKVLESDVAEWLATQDAETIRHINGVIRHIMVLKKV